MTVSLANCPAPRDQRAMTASDLQDHLVATLVRRCGGTQRGWRLALGRVRLYDVATHPHCNWAIDPTGDAREVAAIEALIDEVRLSHPLLAADAR